jgi:parvulin-like peptidyl-prolyl isomerase
MKKQNLIIISVVVITAIALAISYQQGLLPTKGLTANIGGGNQTNNGSASNSSANSMEDWSQSGSQAADLSMTYESLEQLLSNVDANQRQALLNDEAAFSEFVKSVASQKSLLAAAKSNNLQQDPKTSFMMQRSAENTLMEIYLNRLINNKVPAGFPTDEQINEYYENNKDNLVVEERLSVWQIFLPTPEGTTDSQITELESQSRQITDDIRAGRTDFTNAALSYSAHQPSKLNGGNMGILKVSELIPGIHEPLMELDEGEISNPVKSEMGFHILKRGQIIPSQAVTLAQVRGQISNLLTNQIRARLRNEIIQLAADTYPVNYDDTVISEWRTNLTNGL